MNIIQKIKSLNEQWHTKDLRKNTLNKKIIERVLDNRENSYLLKVNIDHFIQTDLVDSWIKTLGQYNNGINSQIKELQKYFNNFQPKNLNHLLGLNLKSEIMEIDIDCHFFPWESYNYKTSFISRKIMMRKEYIPNSEEDKYQDEDGWKGFGPVSDRLVSSEVKRLNNIYESVLHHGWQDKYGFIGAFILKKGNTFKLVPAGGWHRLAVKIFIGEKYIDVKIKKGQNHVIYEESHKWPGVKLEYYSEEDAKSVFNSIYK
ncbi:MAG: hypothetical protein LAT68_02190 [Cyclobacteriaceae bacterium]|nr:hypothetical protein [Cyclobacteriaceae bacterium]MCH8515114.1 hypothetical protein [Cyclobacteriaceae bacterium]